MPPISIVTVSQNRAAALARKFHKDYLPPMVLARDVPSEAAYHRQEVGTVERFAPYPNQAWIWRLPNKDDCSIWARPLDEGKTTRNIFEAFVQELYGDVHYGDRRLYPVDHVYNHANAPHDWYIRLEIIPRRTNSQHGGGFERKNTNSIIEIENRNRAHQSKMTFMMMLKIAGLPPPRSTDDTGRMNVARHYFLQNGWTAQQIDNALRSLLDKAAVR